MSDKAITPQENAAAVMMEAERLTKTIAHDLDALEIEEDETQRKALAARVWQHVEALTVYVEDSAFLIGVSNDSRLIMEEQRDKAVRALEDVVYKAEMNAMSEAKKDAYNAVGKHIMEFLGTDRDTARFWARFFVTGSGAEFLSEEALAGLGIWMREQARAATR